MDEKIENYKEVLNTFCVKCNACNRCKDHSKLCFRKKLIFNIGKRVYAKKQKARVNQ